MHCAGLRCVFVLDLSPSHSPSYTLLSHPGSLGGTLLVMSASVAIHNSTVWSSARGGKLAAAGGAIFVEHPRTSVVGGNGEATTIGASVVLNTTLVYGGTASNGGAVYARNAYVKLVSSALVNGGATEFGGCVYAEVRMIVSCE